MNVLPYFDTLLFYSSHTLSAFISFIYLSSFIHIARISPPPLTPLSSATECEAPAFSNLLTFHICMLIKWFYKSLRTLSPRFSLKLHCLERELLTENNDDTISFLERITDLRKF
jgi:hypothetical protein